MEALSVSEIPAGPEWQYEPKWDGFRSLAFRDRETVNLQSKACKPLTRYFPELASALGELKARRYVIDGEIVVPVGSRFSFDDLLQRIHPAASRINKLAEQHPARLIVFDLLVDENGAEVHKLPLGERRTRLDRFAKRYFGDGSRIRLSPATTDIRTARSWLRERGSNVDGIIAKRLDLEYRSGDRTGMQKIKRLKTADCVVGGFRYLSKQRQVGSLLLGLYDAEGKLNHVGFTSGLKAGDRRGLTKQLEALIKPPGFTGRAPGGPSRWSTDRSTEWEPLAPKLVAEVRYDHFTGGRFRHGTRLLRWRPDKHPSQCTMDQLE